MSAALLSWGSRPHEYWVVAATPAIARLASRPEGPPEYEARHAHLAFSDGERAAQFPPGAAVRVVGPA